MESTPGGFPPTRVSLLARALRGEVPEGREAWGDLFRAYAPPLYAWLRRTGSSSEEALDLLQDFFLEGLEGDLLARFDPARGRLRTWMLACLRNQRLERLRRERNRRDRAPWPFRAGESKAWEPADPERADADRAFEEEWAHEVLERSLAALERDWRTRGDALSPRVLREWVLADPRRPAAALAQDLGISPGDLYTRATRLRQAIAAEVEIQLRELGDVDAGGPDRDELLRALGR